MGKPLLLLPGLACDARLFGPQVAALGEVADPVVADLTRAPTIATMAEGAIARMPPGRFAVAGLSMGGYVALEVARRAPQRVSHLALFNTNARPDSPEATQNRRRLIAVAERDLKAANAALWPRLVHPDRLADRPLEALVEAMALGVGFEAFRRQQEAIIGRVDSRPHLAAIACPTLVVAGREDAIMPMEVSEEMARGIPGARLAVLEHCGHLSTLECPEEATALLRAWLASA
jgi:pimeloyl-ACP methyl ester carboxylesterase